MTQTTKITISERRASTAYSRGNETIVNVFNFGPPNPTHYGPDDFFPIFDMAMSTQHNAVGVSYIQWIANQLEFDANYDAQFLLRQLFAVPIGIFNDPFYGLPYPEQNQLTQGSLAVPSYRVTPPFNFSSQLIVSSASIYGFLAGALLSVFWCVAVICISMTVQHPNSSFYPEVDFASKSVEGSIPHSIGQLLYPLSNANSADVGKRIEGSRLFVTTREDGDVDHVVLSLVGPSQPLNAGEMYA